MITYKSMDNLEAYNLYGQVVMLRADLNVPLNEKHEVTNLERINRLKPTIKELVEKGAKVVIISHLGRPKNREDKNCSLAPVAAELEKALQRNVTFVESCIGGKVQEAIEKMEPGRVMLLENLRYYEDEAAGSAVFASILTAPADVYISDAFSTAHRPHASMAAAIEIMQERGKPAVMGRLMEQEVNSLELALFKPTKPLMAIVGGSKVSTKLDLLRNLVSKVDKLTIVGGMSQTFLRALGLNNINEKNSLVEMGMLETAIEILELSGKTGCELILPKDVVIADKFEGWTKTRNIPVAEVPEKDCVIMDAGIGTIMQINSALCDCKTLVWNGPLGVFEKPPFDNATNMVAQQANALTLCNELYTIAGGGDTVAALENAGVAKSFSYISTAGGAFLELLEGKDLPGVKVFRN